MDGLTPRAFLIAPLATPGEGDVSVFSFENYLFCTTLVSSHWSVDALAKVGHLVLIAQC